RCRRSALVGVLALLLVGLLVVGLVLAVLLLVIVLAAVLLVLHAARPPFPSGTPLLCPPVSGFIHGFWKCGRITGRVRKILWMPSKCQGRRYQMELKDSATKENLLRAFAGESQARNRYTFSASLARKKGLHVI